MLRELITMKRIIILSFLMVVYSSVIAQDINVKSLTLLPNDNTAMEKPVLDNLKDPCALVKIDAKGLKGMFFPKKGRDHKADSFDGDTGLYLVYVPTGTKRLSYNHADYLAGEIVFANYVGELEIGKTYLLTMEATAPTKAESMVIITVNPHDARVVFDGKEAPLAIGGVYTFYVKPGTYDYSVLADDHITHNGTASAEQGQKTKISTDLQWIRHGVSINCNVNDAQVYVDNAYYGKPGKFRLPQGVHTICLKADDYLDMEKSVTINADTPSFDFLLKKNENKVVIGAVEVTIYSLSNSTRIYKNQRQIKEWKKNGDVVKFMPGKYLLSDNDYNEYKLVVKKGSAPMTVKF